MKQAGIFISYRRDDTRDLAGRLFDGLRTHFGPSQVFMDTDGIVRGEKFATALTEALGCCKALLALIGPIWVTCTRKDGRRRLDVDDDWVRVEIAKALARDITVVPVLFRGTALPQEQELPADIRGLLARQKAEILDAHWDDGAKALYAALEQLTGLKPVGHDVASARTGIKVLQDLVARVPAVADAVSRSKEVIANVVKQMSKLAVHKQLHDALHAVEFDCLGPMQESRDDLRLRPFKVPFESQAKRIKKTVTADNVNEELRQDLVDQVDTVLAAFDTAVAAPTGASYGAVVAALMQLLSNLPARIDATMVATAESLELGHLVELMTTIRSQLTAGDMAAPEIAPFVEGVDALDRLRQELAQRVKEHTQLQRLDSKLRAVCTGDFSAPLDKEWSRIMQVRARLVPPFLDELEAVHEDLTALEAEIAAAIASDPKETQMDLVRSYFRTVGKVFREVDRGLLTFSGRLGDVSKPLAALLSTS